MDATLTGEAATDALRVYAGLGALDARFDRRKVAAAVLTAKGRAKLLASTAATRMLRNRSGRSGSLRTMVPRPRARMRRTRRTRQAVQSRSRGPSGPDGPGRPETHPTGSPPESGAEGAGEGASWLTP